MNTDPDFAAQAAARESERASRRRAQESLRKGYGAGSELRQKLSTLSETHRARSWRYDPAMEHLATERGAGRHVSGPMRMRLGIYLADKQLAEQAGIDTTAPTGDAA